MIAQRPRPFIRQLRPKRSLRALPEVLLRCAFLG